jgi:hypothetical protein
MQLCKKQPRRHLLHVARTPLETVLGMRFLCSVRLPHSAMSKRHELTSLQLFLGRIPNHHQQQHRMHLRTAILLFRKRTRSLKSLLFNATETVYGNSSFRMLKGVNLILTAFFPPEGTIQGALGESDVHLSCLVANPLTNSGLDTMSLGAEISLGVPKIWVMGTFAALMMGLILG